jgi:hypothetical protein
MTTGIMSLGLSARAMHANICSRSSGGRSACTVGDDDYMVVLNTLHERQALLDRLVAHVH